MWAVLGVFVVSIATFISSERLQNLLRTQAVMEEEIGACFHLGPTLICTSATRSECAKLGYDEHILYEFEGSGNTRSISEEFVDSKDAKFVFLPEQRCPKEYSPEESTGSLGLLTRRATGEIGKDPALCTVPDHLPTKELKDRCTNLVKTALINNRHGDGSPICEERNEIPGIIVGPFQIGFSRDHPRTGKQCSARCGVLYECVNQYKFTATPLPSSPENTPSIPI